MKQVNPFSKLVPFELPAYDSQSCICWLTGWVLSHRVFLTYYWPTKSCLKLINPRIWHHGKVLRLGVTLWLITRPYFWDFVQVTLSRFAMVFDVIVLKSSHCFHSQIYLSLCFCSVESLHIAKDIYFYNIYERYV